MEPREYSLNASNQSNCNTSENLINNHETEDEEKDFISPAKDKSKYQGHVVKAAMENKNNLAPNHSHILSSASHTSSHSHSTPSNSQGLGSWLFNKKANVTSSLIDVGKSIYTTGYKTIVDPDDAWKQERYRNLLLQIEKLVDKESIKCLRLFQPKDENAHELASHLQKLTISLGSGSYHTNPRQGYHEDFYLSLRKSLLLFKQNPKFSEEYPGIISILENVCFKFFTNIKVLKNLTDIIFHIAKKKENNPKILFEIKNLRLISEKMEILNNALKNCYEIPMAASLKAKAKKLYNFDPLNETNAPWQWCREFYTYKDFEKEVLRIRTGVPLDGGELTPEYRAFLDFCKKNQKKVVQFVHLNPTNFEAPWIQSLIASAEKNYKGVLYIVGLPFDSIEPLLDDKMVNCRTYWGLLMENVFKDPSPFYFPEEIKKNLKEILYEVFQYVEKNYFSINPIDKKAFFGLFYTYLQKKIIFLLDEESPQTIVINHCADAVDRTGEIMACSLATNYYQLNLMNHIEYQTKFLGTVYGPVMAILKRSILPARTKIMHAVIRHLEKLNQTSHQPPKEFLEWKLTHIVLE